MASFYCGVAAVLALSLVDAQSLAMGNLGAFAASPTATPARKVKFLSLR